MEDREYQEVQINQVFEALETYDKILLQLPTGGGKTVEFLKIALRYHLKTNQSVLILVNREELLNQAKKSCIEITKITPHLITSKTKNIVFKRINIGMIGSVISRLNLFSSPGLVIVDECRIAEFNKVHEMFKGAKIIGVDATPVSSSPKDPINNYFQTIITGPQISELISMGFLAQNITRTPKDIVDSTKLRLDKLSGDFDVNQMAIEYKVPKFVTNVVKKYFEYSLGKKTMVFNVNIEHSKAVNDCFIACGFNSRHIDSDSGRRPSSDTRYKNEREETMAWFKETEDAILNNVMLTNFGFDEPTIQTIILNFSTLSLPKFLQCAGRGGRPITFEILERLQPEYPYKLQLKKFFTILDMGGNFGRFGDWSNDRDWNYIFYHPKAVSEGIAAMKTCPQCEGLVHAAATVCLVPKEDGYYCGYEFERPKTREEQDLEEMIMVTKGINVDELMGRYSNKYRYYTFFELGVDVVKEMYARYEEPTESVLFKYFNFYYSLCIDWWNKYMANIDGNMEDITDSQYHLNLAKKNFDKLLIKYKPLNAKIIYFETTNDIVKTKAN